jgi:hypothetical protein
MKSPPFEVLAELFDALPVSENSFRNRKLSMRLDMKTPIRNMQTPAVPAYFKVIRTKRGVIYQSK